LKEFFKNKMGVGDLCKRRVVLRRGLRDSFFTIYPGVWLKGSPPSPLLIKKKSYKKYYKKIKKIISMAWHIHPHTWTPEWTTITTTESAENQGNITPHGAKGQMILGSFYF